MKADNSRPAEMGLIPEPEWETLSESLTESPGVILILGETDSGKSTLARYLTQKMLSRNKKVSIVDSDIGQSTIGLPGTVSAKSWTVSPGGRDRPFDVMCYIGTVNPARVPSIIVKNTERIVKRERKRAEIIIVDTSGLVSGYAGRNLKVRKIEAIRPEHVVALQRYGELEHILGKAADARIHRLKVPDRAKKRSRRERLRYREEKMADYFRTGLSDFLFRKTDIAFFYLGAPTDTPEEVVKMGSIIGLNRNEDTYALGILSEADKHSFVVRSPAATAKGVRKLLLGEIRIDLRSLSGAHPEDVIRPANIVK